MAVEGLSSEIVVISHESGFGGLLKRELSGREALFFNFTPCNFARLLEPLDPERKLMLFSKNASKLSKCFHTA
jgi:hypothetical protein